MLNFGLSDDQRALIDVAKRFAKERIIPVAAECDRESRFPKDVFVAAHELGLVNASVPTEYGGPGMGELENALIAEQLAYGCTGIQTSMLANTLALTPIKQMARRLQIAWGLHCVETEDAQNLDDVAERACQIAYAQGFAKLGDRVVITAGLPLGTPGATNLLRVAYVTRKSA